MDSNIICMILIALLTIVGVVAIYKATTATPKKHSVEEAADYVNRHVDKTIFLLGLDKSLLSEKKLSDFKISILNDWADNNYAFMFTPEIDKSIAMGIGFLMKDEEELADDKGMLPGESE